MTPWIIITLFVAAVICLAWVLGRRETDGSFDVGPGSASRPGLKRLFDFGAPAAGPTTASVNGPPTPPTTNEPARLTCIQDVAHHRRH